MRGKIEINLFFSLKIITILSITGSFIALRTQATPH